MQVRWVATLALVVSGLFVTPGGAHAVPGFCPPICDAIPDSAWIEPGSLPLAPIYRWPALTGVAVTAPAPRFEFESWCVTPASTSDPRRYAVAARAETPSATFARMATSTPSAVRPGPVHPAIASASRRLCSTSSPARAGSG